MEQQQKMIRLTKRAEIGRVEITYDGPAPAVFLGGALGGGLGAMSRYLLIKNPLGAVIGGIIGVTVGVYFGALVESS